MGLIRIIMILYIPKTKELMINRENKPGTGKNKDKIKKIQESDKHSGKDFSGEKLFSLDLSKKDFSKCSFEGANLSSSNLSNCDFSNSNLSDTDLTGTLLRYCIFTGSQRAGKQILGHASITIGDDCHYAFLCQGKKGKTVLINEQSKTEYEYKQAGASSVSRILHNLLFLNA